MENRLARHVAFVGVLGIAVLAIGHVTLAGVVANSPELPPSVGVFRSQPGDYAEYRGVMLDDQIADVGFWHSVNYDGLNVVRTPFGPNEEDELDVFDSVLVGMITVGDSSFPLEVMGPTEVVVLGKWGKETGTFATEIISM